MKKMLLFSEAWGQRRQGRPKQRWLEGVTGDLAVMHIINWRRETQESELCRKIVKVAMAHFGL